MVLVAGCCSCSCSSFPVPSSQVQAHPEIITVVSGWQSVSLKFEPVLSDDLYFRWNPSWMNMIEYDLSGTADGSEIRWGESTNVNGFVRFLSSTQLIECCCLNVDERTPKKTIVETFLGGIMQASCRIWNIWRFCQQGHYEDPEPTNQFKVSEADLIWFADWKGLMMELGAKLRAAEIDFKS